MTPNEKTALIKQIGRIINGIDHTRAACLRMQGGPTPDMHLAAAMRELREAIDALPASHPETK